MKKYGTHVGMDVHARSIACQACIVETGETKTKVFSDCPAAVKIAEWLAQE